VHDQRIEVGSVFGGEDPGDSLVLRRIGTQTIDGFGRKSDKIAFDQGLRGMGDGLGQATILVAIEGGSL
jgi:hypothetical protein